MKTITYLFVLLLFGCATPVPPELQPTCGNVAGTVIDGVIRVGRHCVR